MKAQSSPINRARSGTITPKGAPGKKSGTITPAGTLGKKMSVADVLNFKFPVRG